MVDLSFPQALCGVHEASYWVGAAVSDMAGASSMHKPELLRQQGRPIALEMAADCHPDCPLLSDTSISQLLCSMLLHCQLVN